MTGLAWCCRARPNTLQVLHSKSVRILMSCVGSLKERTALDRDQALWKKDPQPPFECWGALRSWTPQQPAGPLNTHVLRLHQGTSPSRHVSIKARLPTCGRSRDLWGWVEVLGRFLSFRLARDPTGIARDRSLWAALASGGLLCP